MRDHLQTKLDAIRACIRRLEDEGAQHRALGRDALADKIEHERKKAEIEAGYVENLLRGAA